MSELMPHEKRMKEAAEREGKEWSPPVTGIIPGKQKSAPKAPAKAPAKKKAPAKPRARTSTKKAAKSE
jgi:hypothetical protein